MKRELGTFERALVISDQHAPFHIVSVLQLENAPPPHLLEQALKVLQKRHPFLAARLLKEKGKLYFASLVEPGLPFHFLPRWNAEHWSHVAEAELGNRIDVSTGPLFRCTYLYSVTDRRGDIILSFFHSMIDASSASQLMHQLLTACASLMDEKTATVYEFLPAPPAESRFPSAFRGLPLTMKTLQYTFEQMTEEFAYRIQTRNKRIPPLHKQRTRGHILSLQLSEDLTESFAQRARKEGITLNSALNAALLLAVNRNLYAGQPVPMRTFTFADLRPYVQPPLSAEELACYVSMLRFTVLVGDKFLAATMAESLMTMVTWLKAFRMGATALNYNGIVPVQLSYDNIKVTGLHGFISAFDLGPEFSAQAQIFNNQLCIDFIYLDADMSRDEAKAIVEEIKSILNSAI